MVLENGEITLKKILKFQLFARLDGTVCIIPTRKHSNLWAVLEGVLVLLSASLSCPR